ncbi:uncharacterized protein PRCAT00001080001 [Priceomyces carsonii]|uniref:uncharacterized protein n=1 Tax=Priceomyces carsonii TaxID=28549 RepID=UPI002ED97A4A|nr:unnamed protein product [Priceomyces carsonii]
MDVTEAPADVRGLTTPQLDGGEFTGQSVRNKVTRNDDHNEDVSKNATNHGSSMLELVREIEDKLGEFNGIIDAGDADLGSRIDNLVRRVKSFEDSLIKERSPP